MKRFSAKFPLNRRLFLGLAAAGALSGCGVEGQSDVSGVDSEVGQLEMGRAEQALVAHLDKAALALGTARAEFARQGFHRDVQGVEHTRFQQTVRGVPVFGGEAIVHIDPMGAQTITDDFRQGLQLDVTPRLADADAISRAVGLHGGFDKLTARPESKLMVLRQDKGDTLVYRVQLRREDGSGETSMPVYFIDAKTGEKVFGYDNLQTAGATGTLKTLYWGSPTGTVYLSGSTYYLEDVTRKVGTFDMRNTTSTTNRATSTTSTFGNNLTSNAMSAAADAHFGAQKTYDYFKNTHARNGIDGSGGPAYYTSIDGATGLISSVVHYSTSYNNAFWNGSYMTYGDGDGTTFKSLVAIDICGHEMTHGITERSAGLTYSGESGALNESMSDVFGAMVELYANGGVEDSGTWQIGEDSYTPSTSGDALRYMNNPRLAPNRGYTVDDDPDYYSERYTGTADNGGVHINSGIANHAFYLLAKGGTHRKGGTVTGIGTAAAAKIWYRALTSYMTSSTNFSGARTATLNAASALYGGTGSTQYKSVAQAWTAVGVL